MGELVPEDTSAQLVTPAKAVSFEPAVILEKSSAAAATGPVAGTCMPALQDDSKPADSKATAAADSKDAEPMKNNKRTKPASEKRSESTSNSSSSSSGTESEPGKPVVPKHGRRKAWRSVWVSKPPCCLLQLAWTSANSQVPLDIILLFCCSCHCSMLLLPACTAFCCSCHNSDPCRFCAPSNGCNYAGYYSSLSWHRLHTHVHQHGLSCAMPYKQPLLAMPCPCCYQ